MFKKIIFITILIVVILGAMAYVLLYTRTGAQKVTEYVFSRYGDIGELIIEPTENLSDGITLKDIGLNNLKNLPAVSKLKIQKLFVRLTALSLDGLIVEFENARLQLPHSEPILVIGSFREQTLDLDIFSRGFTVNEILESLPDLKALVPLKGEVNNVDLYVKGHYLEPQVTGTFEIEQFIYKGFVLEDGSWDIDLNLKDIQKDIQLYGRVNIEQGLFRTKKILINLLPGYIDFSGPWDQPEFDLKGKTVIEKTKINISIKGTLDSPDLTLSSTPSYSKQKLMLMLATGKSWQSVEDSLDSGVFSKDLTKDFIDYFIFAGKGNAFAKKFGIKEFTVTFNGDAKGVGARKNLTDKLDVGYSVEKQRREKGESSTIQKVGSEYKVTDAVSVGVEKEVTKENKSSSLDEFNSESTTNDKVYLEYKKEF